MMTHAVRLRPPSGNFPTAWSDRCASVLLAVGVHEQNRGRVRCSLNERNKWKTQGSFATDGCTHAHTISRSSGRHVKLAARRPDDVVPPPLIRPSTFLAGPSRETFPDISPFHRFPRPHRFRTHGRRVLKVRRRRPFRPRALSRNVSGLPPARSRCY